MQNSKVTIFCFNVSFKCLKDISFKKIIVKLILLAFSFLNNRTQLIVKLMSKF